MDIQKIAAAPALRARSMIPGCTSYSRSRSSYVTSSVECTSRIAPFTAAPAFAKPASSPAPTSTMSAVIPPTGVGGDQPPDTSLTGNGAGRQNLQPRLPLAPSGRHRELLGVNRIHARVTQRFDRPRGCAAGRRRSRHASTDRICQHPQIFFERRGTLRAPDHQRSEVRARLFHRARARSLRHLPEIRRRTDRSCLTEGDAAQLAATNRARQESESIEAAQVCRIGTGIAFISENFANHRRSILFALGL